MNYYKVAPSPDGYIGDVATKHLFGANTIFTKDYLDPGGPYDLLSQQLGFTDFRFPGGTVTEEMFGPGGLMVERFFSLEYPNGVDPDGGQRILTTPAMFEYAAAQGTGVHYVLPTERYFSDDIDASGHRVPTPFGLYRLLDRVDDMIGGDYGVAQIDSFTIGNEFWYEDDRLTVEEYARMADQVSTGLERVFQAHRLSLEDPTAWDAPKIAIQAGRGWESAENQKIIAGLSMQARGAIDMIVQHFYPRNIEVIPHFGGPFDRMDDFANAPGFGELDYFVSEWNISSSKSGADAGLQHASALPEIVATFLERGVDEAAIWGTQYLNLHARLSGLTRSGEEPSGYSYFLTPGGDMFRWMREDIPGTRLLDVSTSGTLRTQLGVPMDERPVDERDQMVMQAFQGPDHTTVYLSSRTDQEMGVTFDPSLIVAEYNHLEIQTLTALDDPTTTGLDEGDPDTPKARPFISNISTEDVQTTDGFQFTLSPWEIVRMRFTTGEVGVTLSGHDQLVDPAADYGDHLVGSAFDDTLIGYHGDDFLEGETGNDFIDGGDGDDTLDGGYGFDTLLGGPGDDVIRGRRQPDILASGTGTNMLTGGVGPDHFIIDPNSITTVTDIDLRDNETISFMRHYGTVGEVLTRATVESGDIVIRHDTGGRTVLSGLAPEFSSLGDILADQITGSPTADIVNRLLAVPPDGSVATNPDPGTVEDPNAISGEIQREFERVLNSDNPDALEAVIDALTSAKFGQILQEINVNVLFLTAPPPTLVVLGNHMTREQIDAFWASSIPGNASVLVNRFLDDSGGVFPVSLLNLAPYPLSVLIYNLSADTEDRLLASMSQEQIDSMANVLAKSDLHKVVTWTGDNRSQSFVGDDAGFWRNDIFLGFGGNDKFSGLSGSDIFHLGPGANYVMAGGGDDDIWLEGSGQYPGSLEAWNVDTNGGVGTSQILPIEGLVRFENVVDGGPGSDTVHLTSANDALFLHDSFSGFHSDVLTSSDTLGNQGAVRLENIETILAGAGNDFVDLVSPDYDLAGHQITVEGGEGNDIIWGSNASEYLKGGPGDDTLFGGMGEDTLSGGSGADIFEFTRTSTASQILDFSLADGDFLHFYNTGDARFNASSLTLTDTGISIDYLDTSTGDTSTLDITMNIGFLTRTDLQDGLLIM